MPRSRSDFRVFLAVLGVLVALSPVQAQESGPPKAKGRAQTGGLEEVVITARKREESLQDTPVTAEVMSQETIQNFGVNSLESIAALSPQFFVGRSSNGSGAQMTIRGIGSSSTSIGLEQSVAVILDGVYYGQGRILNEGMIDLERVELLKGPQALFFGKNATAGAVSLTSNKPTAEFEARGQVGYDFEAEQTAYEGVVSGPLTDTLGARLALRYTDMDGGYFENKANAQPYDPIDVATGNIIQSTSPKDHRDAPGEEELIGRLTLGWNPTDDLAVTFSTAGTDAKVKQSSWNYVAYSCPGGVSALNPADRCNDHFEIWQNRMPPVVADTFRYAKGDGDLYNEYTSSSYTANIEYQLGAFSLTSVTNYQENKNKFGLSGDFQSSPNSTFATEKSTWEAFSEEVRLASDFDGDLNFMVGLLYQDTKRKFDQWVATGGLANTAAAEPYNVFVAFSKNSSTNGDTWSPFFEITYEITDTLTFSGGARYTNEGKNSSFVHPYINPGFQDYWRENETAKADQSWDKITPEATLSWQATDDIMAYVAYKAGYKSGGFSNSGIYSTAEFGGSASDFTFEPETAKGYEGGIKSTLLDNQVRLNLTGYYYEFDDLQVDFFNSPTFAFITLNAGKAETQGFELEGEYAPFALPGLNLRGSIAYNDAKYKDFIAPCWAGQTPEQGCNTTVPGTAGIAGQDISDEPTAMAPEWSASLGIAYDGNFNNGWGYGVALDGMYSDDYNPSAFANPHSKRGDFTTLNASVYLAGEDGAWEVRAIGKNLTDEFIVNGVVDGPSTGLSGEPFADQFGFVSLPRTVAMQVTVHFQ